MKKPARAVRPLQGALREVLDRRQGAYLCRTSSQATGLRGEGHGRAVRLPRGERWRPQQVQDFTPTPMTLATDMYYSGYHRTRASRCTCGGRDEKAMQRALLQLTCAVPRARLKRGGWPRGARPKRLRRDGPKVEPTIRSRVEVRASDTSIRRGRIMNGSRVSILAASLVLGSGTDQALAGAASRPRRQVARTREREVRRIWTRQGRHERGPGQRRLGLDLKRTHASPQNRAVTFPARADRNCVHASGKSGAVDVVRDRRYGHAGARLE